MLPAKLVFEGLGLLVLLSFASTTSVITSDGYYDVWDADLRGLHVFVVSCKNYDNENSSLPCRLSRELLYYEKNETKFCDLVLDGQRVMKLQALSEDLAALNWNANYTNDYFFTTTIINFSNCNSFEVKINRTLHSSDLKFDAYRFATTSTSGYGQFHTVFHIPYMCDAWLCILAFNEQDKQPQLSNFFKDTFEKSDIISDVKRLDWEGEHYIASGGQDLTLKYYLLTSNDCKFLMEFSLEAEHTRSTTEKTIRFCQQTGDKPREINCTAFDTSGEIVSNVTVNWDERVIYSEVENLPDDEFLLFTYTEEDQRSYVTKVASDGERIGTFELIGLPECKSYLRRDLNCYGHGNLKIVDNKFCRSVLRFWFTYTDRGVNYGSKCFSDDDFE